MYLSFDAVSLFLVHLLLLVSFALSFLHTLSISLFLSFSLSLSLSLSLLTERPTNQGSISTDDGQIQRQKIGLTHPWRSSPTFFKSFWLWNRKTRTIHDLFYSTIVSYSPHFFFKLSRIRTKPEIEISFCCKEWNEEKNRAYVIENKIVHVHENMNFGSFWRDLVKLSATDFSWIWMISSMPDLTVTVCVIT